MISDQQAEITFRGIILAILLTVVLATANTFLALKVGILTSASIPAAIIAMGVLRFFPHSNILENNQVQTCASAGEAVAGGVVYTIPALIIIHYWTHFHYVTTWSLALLGGLLGVLFSIPLRRVLLNEPILKFPEGQAIAEVLKHQHMNAQGMREILMGGSIGALLQLGQSGFKLLASQVSCWVTIAHNTIVGFGLGLSSTLLGAGYLIGINVGASILLGAVISWLFGIPVVSHLNPVDIESITPVLVSNLWNQHIFYIGIGAMLIGSLWTLLNLVKPILISLRTMITMKLQLSHQDASYASNDIDLPPSLVITSIVISLLATAVLFANGFVVLKQHLVGHWYALFIISCVLYVAIIGFLFSAICGYFSGLVGVSACPGSAIIIIGVLIAALGINSLLLFSHQHTQQVFLLGAAITIMIGAIVTSTASIALDNIQDLKVGQLVGATPWKQQLMLLLGVFVATLIVPLVMELLFNAYGIAGVFPHAHMDPNNQLPAPPAALMATLTQGVFQHDLPWSLLLAGGMIIAGMVVLQACYKPCRQLSIIGVAIGIYLPLTTSTPLFIGALIQYLTQRRQAPREQSAHAVNYGTLIACGLIAGSTLMDVVLALPVLWSRNPDVWRLLPERYDGLAAGLGLIGFAGVAYWFYRSHTSQAQ